MNEQHISEIGSNLHAFVETVGADRIQSTSAKLVSYNGILYNVDGSSGDPKLGVSWKQLLINWGINANCYADTPVPVPPSTHPQFNVGGHVTPLQSGKVVKNGICYLMPLCSWHNSKTRDTLPFSHANTQMLQLFGYIPSEPVETFKARYASEAPFSLVYLARDGLAFEHLESDMRGARKSASLRGHGGEEAPLYHILFERHEQDGEVFYTIADSRTG